jgi:hypothetical protein
MAAFDGELIGGPQDGAKIRSSGGDVFHAVYVGPKWLGDGFAAYSSGGPSGRFPALYVHEGSGRYYFRGYRKPRCEEPDGFGTERPYRQLFRPTFRRFVSLCGIWVLS